MFKKTTVSPPNYVADSEKCIAFLSNYTDRYDNDRPKYMEQLQSIANRDSRVLEIALDDVEQHFSSNPEFITSITHNTRRYQQLFYKAADSIMPAPTKSLDDKSDIYDILNNFRQERLSTTQTTDVLPHELKRRYELHLIPRTLDKPLKLRAIKAKHVGSLVSVKGIVTRTTDVLPLVKVVTYLCDACGCESYQTVDDRTFNPLQQCPSQSCIKNDIKGKLHQLTRGSKFVRYQEIKLQELHTEVPIGHIPRTITLRSFGELTRQCKPGDLITVTGIFLPIKYEGFRAVRAGLTADTYIEVTHLVPAKQSYSEYTLTPELEAEVESKSQEKDIYSQLAQSIAPEIYGHEDIKKALVLLLVSGVNRHMEDGMKIRGDINVLLMGDPGVAKSQLLKHITTIAPRAVYTTGKGSSGVGLTAAVLRDPTTGEMTLEGGALVLADMGICCIDEFDKMEDADRTAIHEVMEQQTVSIAKAGIVTTLNARTSILAAANPVYGRWKLSETPETNLGLPTALLSRFDLTFIILDKPNEANDEALARHITHVHRENTHPPLDFTPFSSSFLRAYVAKARSFTPYIPNDKELMDFIVGSYVGLRKEDDQEETLPSHKYRQQSQSNNNRQRFCTARSLLSILRLSQGLARIHMRNVVTREDVEEAIRLLYVSKNTALEEEEKVVRLDPMTRVFNVIKNYCQENKTKTISRADLRGRLFAKNLSEKLLDETLVQYEELDILKVSRDRQTITIISGN